MSAIINNVCVNFEVVDNQIFTNSLQIAEVFEKQHSNVLRDIENLTKDDFKNANFIKSKYLNSQNKPQPLYNLTKDGFMLLVMGFTGAKAYKFKVAFINAFNEMQKELERLRERERVDKIANLEMVQISQNKHFQNVINGYKSQIAQKNEQIANLKVDFMNFDMANCAITQIKRKCSDKSLFIANCLQKLQYFNYRFLEHLQIYALNGIEPSEDSKKPLINALIGLKNIKAF